MAGFFQEFLRGAAQGFINPDGAAYLRDYKHASKTFIPNAYANTPKFKWLFHVYFEINKSLITDNIGAVFPGNPNYGLMVKSISLPKFEMDITELNQYNRKRYIQNKIKYAPVNISFHDDNNNTIRNLWYTYYSYYYNDPSQPQNLNRGASPSVNAAALNATSSAANYAGTNIYSPNISENGAQNWGYAGEASTSTNAQAIAAPKAPFFSSISIFGFNQHNFAQYQLINPIIESFNHDTYSYAESSGTMENTMTVKYESVKYYEGALNGLKPDEIVSRFGEVESYDKTPSPISIPGSTRTILGQGGLVEATNGVLKDLANGNVLGAIQTAARTAQTFKTGSNVVSALKTEVLSEVNKAISSSRGNFNMPTPGSQNSTGSQTAAATNQAATNATPIPVPANSPITGPQ